MIVGYPSNWRWWYLAEPELLSGIAVVALYAREQGDQRGDDDDQQPRPGAELAGEEDDGGDRGEQRAGAVECCSGQPPGAALCVPVSDQAKLADREADEHAGDCPEFG